MLEEVNKPEDWGVASKDEWVADQPLSGEAAMPALEGRDVVGFSESVDFAVELAPGKPDGVQQWTDKSGRPVKFNPSTKSWYHIDQSAKKDLQKKLGQQDQQAQPARSPEQGAKQKAQNQTAAPGREQKVREEPVTKYNISIPNRAKRGSSQILLDEESLKEAFPDPDQQEKVRKVITALNSQLENGKFKSTEGKGGKKDRTFLWEEAEALANRQDSSWTNLMRSGPPYPQELVDEFKDHAFTKNVPRSMAEYVYSLLPATAKVQLNKNGTPVKGQIFTGEGETPQDQSEGSAFTPARGVSVLHAFLKQGGRDAYTGLPVNLGDTEAEHINVQQSGGLDHPSNLVLIRGGVNQIRGGSSLQKLVDNAKSAYSDGGEDAQNKLESLRGQRATGSQTRAGAKEQINAIPEEQFLRKNWQEVQELNQLTGGDKGQQYALRRVDLYNLGDRLRGGKVVLPKTIAEPMGTAFFNGDQETKNKVLQSRDLMRSSFSNWLNKGTGSAEDYIKSVKNALDVSKAAPEQYRRAFLDKFFIDLANTQNNWLVKAHGYKETTPQELKQYYDSL
jgi:hypothetical protein